MNIRSIVKAVIPRQLFRKIEPWGHLGEAVLFNVIYGFPGRGLKVIGVTGTNGKTSTCFLIHRMLSEAGLKTGLMTTVGWAIGQEITPQVQHMTNVAVPELMRRLKHMKREGAEWLVLETTSHGLAQNRLWGIPFHLAVMTNVTHEHLDYHGTFENYRDAKRKLFKLANRPRHGLRTGVINAEDPSAELFKSDIATAITYGVKNGDLRASKVEMTPTGSSYQARIGDDIYQMKCQLPGGFNVYNSLAAVAVGRVIGLDKNQIEQGIAALKEVEGRMVAIDEGQPFSVLVDFAHTPDAFEKIFQDFRPLVKGRMIVVFGCPGRRDDAKIPIQGKLAGKYCDIVVVSEEDHRDMDGDAIMKEAAEAAASQGKIMGKDLFIEPLREDGVAKAIKLAQPGDLVLLLGKGHEKTMLGNGPEAAKLRHLPQNDDDPRRVIARPYDEVATAHRILKEK